MGIMKRITILCVILTGMSASLSAQLKIGYILSERIRGEYEEFKEAESLSLIHILSLINFKIVVL